MEVMDIDWKNIDSTFVEDDVYEHISAPKWIDFSMPDEPVDDEAWFCRADCKHSKIKVDFRKSPVSKVKNIRFTSNSENVPLGEKYSRDPNLKKKGLVSASIASSYDLKTEKNSENVRPGSKASKFREESENENPNISPSLNHRDLNPKKKGLVSASFASLYELKTEKNLENIRSGSKASKCREESENENPNISPSLNHRDLNPKKKGLVSASIASLYELKTEKNLENVRSGSKASKCREESENENPNISPSLNHRDPRLKKGEIVSASIVYSSDPKPKKILSENARSEPKPPNFHRDCKNENRTSPAKSDSSSKGIVETGLKLRTEKILQPGLNQRPLNRNNSPEITDSNKKKTLKSSFSARNLFAGRDILNQISEFCNELKKLASIGNHSISSTKSNQKRPVKESVFSDFSGNSCELPGNLNEEEPLRGVNKQFSGQDSGKNSDGTENRSKKEKQKINLIFISSDIWRKKRNEGNENSKVILEETEIHKGGDHGSFQVQSCPPTPQRVTKTIHVKSPSRTVERGILQELEQNKKAKADDEGGKGIVDAEARSLDVFWFLKPCTYVLVDN